MHFNAFSGLSGFVPFIFPDKFLDKLLFLFNNKKYEEKRMNLSAFTLLDFLNLFTLCSSILGILLSLLLLLSLNLTKKLSLLINPILNFKWSSLFKFLDKHIEIDSFFFRYSLVFGLLISFSSIYVLFYFLTEFDSPLFLSSLSVSAPFLPFIETAILLVLISGGILTTLALFSGLGMIFFPSTFQSVNARLSRWISIESPELKSTTIQKDTDTICFLHSHLFGSILLLISLILLALSLLNIHHCGFSFRSF